MSPQLMRAVFSILVIRAIFISPAQGADLADSTSPADSSWHRGETIRPSRLRFTNQSPPSASTERFDCIDGGDGNDDERVWPDETSVEAWPLHGLSRSFPLVRHLVGTLAPSFVRLRC